MPSPRTYIAVPSASSGPDYSSQIDELNNKFNTLQAELSQKVSYRPKIELYNVAADITTDVSFDLENVPTTDSIEIEVITGPELHKSFDFTVTGKTITLLASSDLVSSLSSGDVLEISYSY